MEKTQNNPTTLDKILRAKNTVFTFKELRLIFPKIKEVNLKRQISYYCEHGKLLRLRRGIYAKDKDFDPYELATKIYSPSYISFETVLRNAGIIFQDYKAIRVAAKVSRTLKIRGVKIEYIKMPERVLGSSLGIIKQGFYTIASSERAMADILYKHKNYHFDNTSRVDQEFLTKLKKIYAK